MRTHRKSSLSVIFLILLFLTAKTFAAEHNPDWAEPVELEGVPNLHRVTPDFYRSAQPTAAGMKALEKFGIRTVISLRRFNSDRDELKGTGLSGIAIPMNTWDVEIEDVVRVLKVLQDKRGAPYLLHCQHGADRTGTMSAMYRIVLQGWSKEKAITEMTEGGFGYHSIWGNLIKLIEKSNVEEIKKRLQD